MKKIIIGFLIFSLFVVGGLVIMNAVKGDGSEELIGTWSVEVKHDDLNTGFNVSFKGAPTDYVDYSNVDKTITYTFDENGYYTINVDVEEYIAEFTDAVKAGVTTYYEELIESEDSSLSVEEYMAMVGDSFDSYINQETVEKIRNDEGNEIKGKYKLKGTKVYLSAGVEYEPDTKDESSYLPIEIEGNTLTIYKNSNAGFSLADANFYPLVLTKK